MKDTRKDEVTSQGSDIATDGYVYSTKARKMIANKEYPYDVEFSDEYSPEGFSVKEYMLFLVFMAQEERRGQKYPKHLFENISGPTSLLRLKPMMIIP